MAINKTHTSPYKRRKEWISSHTVRIYCYEMNVDRSWDEFIVKSLTHLHCLRLLQVSFSQEKKLFQRVFFNEIIQRYHWGPVPLPRFPVQRQLWVLGGGLVWWLSRICCTSCSAEKPELLFPLLQVHLMPWTAGREEETQTSARQPHRPAPHQHPPTDTAGERRPNCPTTVYMTVITGPVPQVFCLFLQKCSGLKHLWHAFDYYW